MLPAHRQDGFAIRCEWGADGAAALAPHADVAVIVDVLSFTTAVSVAADAGIDVFPHRWRDASAAAYAAAHDAALAVGRSAAGPGDVSLSPVTLRAAHGIRRVVLPSPNGSTVAHTLAEVGTVTVVGCLRNATAVGRWIARRVGPDGTVAVIPAGERWPTGGLRPAIEDLWGAGAVITALLDASPRSASPEARHAVAAWSAVRGEYGRVLRDCASGRELVGIGFAADVEIAAELNASTAVPVLIDGAFRPAPPAPPAP